MEAGVDKGIRDALSERSRATDKRTRCDESHFLRIEKGSMSSKCDAFSSFRHNKTQVNAENGC